MKQPTTIRPPRVGRPHLLIVAVIVLSVSASAGASSLRRSALVRAIQRARPAVVSIHGHKIDKQHHVSTGEGPRRVNGMGTGVIIDPRGYIVTNYHVVESVGEIKVNLDSGRPYVARLIAHDPYTDLAIIKIPSRQDLPLINIGTSQDLMTGEDVIAVGNAYGYEQTVTRGIISALHRTVQVNDDQKYYDLIQTDASINPGNSGGPLLNIDGEMIGINVAVRVGAQGIGFAIPVDKAMDIAAQLLSKERNGVWHGVIPARSLTQQSLGVVAQRIQIGSPAESAGIKPGDVIKNVNNAPIRRSLDIERALIGARPGQKLSMIVARDGANIPIKLTLANAATPSRRSSKSSVFDVAWNTFGMQLAEIPERDFRSSSEQFKGGLRIVTVRAGSPAAQQGVRSGDVLVGLHKWETASSSDLSYILKQDDVVGQRSVKFYILRGDETLFGHLPATRLR